MFKKLKLRALTRRSGCNKVALGRKWLDGVFGRHNPRITDKCQSSGVGQAQGASHSRTRVTGTRTSSASISRSTKARVVENYGKVPMRCEVNPGQTDATVKFRVRGRGYRLFLTGSEAVVARKKPLPSSPSATPPTDRAVSTSLRMRLSGANPNATLDALRYRSATRRVDPPENFEKQETECTQICLRKTGDTPDCS